jgi:hypothetical protein
MLPAVEVKVNEEQNDQITLETRIIGGSVIVVLLLAFFALYIEPDQTDLNFAWTILPRTSALLMGAGYTAGAYFFARVIAEKKWHRVEAGFLAITGFTICLLAATLLHLNRFHQGTLQFYLWTVIYALTPFIVPFLWWRNHKSASTDLEEYDLRFSLFIRWMLGIVALVGVLSFLTVFIQPLLLIGAAPWKLTELTARVFAGWSMLTFLTVLTIAYDGRWSATRYLLQSAMIGIALTLLALPRMWNDFDQTKPMTYIFIASVISALIVFLIMHLRLDKIGKRNARV